MDKKQVTNIPHWTTTSTEGGLLLKEENRDKIEQIRNSINKEDTYKVLMENLIRFHVNRKWENDFNGYKFDYFIRNEFYKILECEFPVGTSIVGELYTTYETKDITKQEVEKYIKENFNSYNDFKEWVINEMLEKVEEKTIDEVLDILTYHIKQKFRYEYSNNDVLYREVELNFYKIFFKDCSIIGDFYGDLDNINVTKDDVNNWISSYFRNYVDLKNQIHNKFKNEFDKKYHFMPELIKYHIKEKWQSEYSYMELNILLKDNFNKIFECVIPFKVRLLGSLNIPSGKGMEIITNQNVENYINGRFSNYDEFHVWVCEEFLYNQDKQNHIEYPYPYKLTYVEDNLFELLQEYICSYYDVIKDDEFYFSDYLDEEIYDGTVSVGLAYNYVSKFIEDVDGGFTITGELIEDAINKHFSSLEALQLWYNAKNKEYGINKIESLQKEVERCNEFANEYEKSYDSLIQKESHYNQEVFPEVIKMMETIFGIEETKIFCKLNAFKYRMRAGYKSEDIVKEIKKALDYEERYKQYSKQQQLCQD